MMYPLVYIQWVDAHSSPSEWLDEGDFLTCMNIDVAHTVGYLIHEDEVQVKVAASYFTNKLFCGGMAIPKSCILMRQVLVDPSGQSTPTTRPLLSDEGKEPDDLAPTIH